MYAVKPSHACIFGGTSLDEAGKAVKKSSKTYSSLVFSPKMKKPFSPVYSYYIVGNMAKICPICPSLTHQIYKFISYINFPKLKSPETGLPKYLIFCLPLCCKTNKNTLSRNNRLVNILKQRKSVIYQT